MCGIGGFGGRRGTVTKVIVIKGLQIRGGSSSYELA
jgi:hypothetical protein